MKREIERITKLLEEKKISEAEYADLLNSIKGPSSQSALWKRIIVDPFTGVSSTHVLVFAVVVLMLLPLAGFFSGVHFPGTIDLKIGYFDKLGLMNLFFQNVIIVVVTSTFFLAGALVCRCKNIRIIDIFISVSIARHPYIIAALFVFIYTKIFGGSFDGFYSSLLLILPIILGCVIWAGVLSFKALKYSFGISGKALWIIFIVGLLFSEASSVAINKKFILKSLHKDEASIEAIFEHKKHAKQEADIWLKLIDQEKHDDSWHRTSLYFQKVVSKKKWQNMMTGNDEEGGTLVSRKYFKTKVDDENKKVISIMYNSHYSVMGEVVEKVVLKKQLDNKWKVEGYWLK